MPSPKFSVGQKVNHPAATDGSFPAGTGTISAVNADGTYRVKCDVTGKVLSPSFKEADLSAA